MRKRNTFIQRRVTTRGRGVPWDLLRSRLATAVVAAAAIYFVQDLVLGEMGLVKFYRMRAQYIALERDIAQMKRENAELLQNVRALKSDPALIERIARDKLGLARPGEIVYYYGQPEP